MRLCVKKIYCPNCQRLVRGHEQRTDTKISVLCPRCGLVLWVRDSIIWRYAAKSA